MLRYHCEYCATIAGKIPLQRSYLLHYMRTSLIENRSTAESQEHEIVASIK